MVNELVKYKKTGVKWIPEIPEHWSLVRLKDCTYINKTTLGEQTDIEYKISYIDISNVNEGKIEEIQKLLFKDAPSRARRIIKFNDVIISTVRTYLRAIALIDVEVENLIGSTGFAVLTAHNSILPKFLFYSINAPYFINKVMVHSLGIAYPAITSTSLGCIPILLPPIKDQQEIISHLDLQSEKVNRFIQAKQRFIELLKEQRQSIINDAVTNGINPNVEFKPSGISDLGDIPLHWTIIRVKYLFSEISDKSDDGIGTLLMASQVHGLVPRAEYHSKAEAAQTTIGHKKCKPGDLIFNKLKAHLGIFFESNYDGLVSPDYAVYRPVKDINSKYYELLFRHPAFLKQFIIKSTGIVEGLIRLYSHELFSIHVPLPPQNEVRDILKYIDTSTKTINLAIYKAEKEIDLIKEYREAMIAEAVMGNLRL